MPDVITAVPLLKIWGPNQVWGPNEGPQLEYLSNSDFECLYGGAAGGGKSDGLLMCAAGEISNKHHRAIIFRQTYPELKDLIERSMEIYPHLGGRYRSSSRDWFFPSGARIEFGYIEKKKDIKKYKRAWNFIGFDELTHWADDEAYVFMIGRCRARTGTGLLLRVRSTTNPGGVGHNWVRKRFAIPDDGTRSEVFDTTTKHFRVFIPSRITDNPHIDPIYEVTLNALPEHTRRALKDGRWDVIEGAMFREFDHRIHTCNSFPLNPGWQLWRGADDGYNAPACVLWAAKHDGRTYIVGELYRPGMTPELMAETTQQYDGKIPMRDGEDEPFYNTKKLAGAIDSSAFNETGVGNSSGTGRGQIMNTHGCNWVPAQKGPGSRIAGCNLIHSLLTKKLADGLPALVIFKNCVNTIRVLSTIPFDKNNLEDTDPDFADDHPYDATRYLLQYKPNEARQIKLKGT